MPALVRQQPLQRSTLTRCHHHRAPEWQAGWPLLTSGWLATGRPWALAFGIDDEGPAADYAVSTSSWNVGIESARHTGTLDEGPGSVNHAHGGQGRALCWLVDDPVAGLVVDTDRGELEVTLAHRGEQATTRVFLAVLDHPTVALRAARHLDQHGRELRREDLGWAQQRFDAALAEQRDGRQPGTKAYLERKRAELGPGAIFHIFGEPPVDRPESNS